MKQLTPFRLLEAPWSGMFSHQKPRTHLMDVQQMLLPLPEKDALGPGRRKMTLNFLVQRALLKALGIASALRRAPQGILFLCFQVISICFRICLCKAYVTAFLDQATLDKTLGAKASRARLHTSYQPADLDAFRTGQSWHSTLLS